MSAADRPGIAVLPAHLSIATPLLALALSLLLPLDILPPPLHLPTLAAGLALIAVAGGVTRGASRAFAATGTNIDPRQPALRLAETGPYRITRNPMYLAMILLNAGLCLALSLDAGLFLLPLLWVALHFGVVLREEAYLSDKFGAPYRDYLARTRRWI